MRDLPKLLAVVGPTASGKTKLAVTIARAYNGEIISADSRQVYQGMDIGTGKDLEEYGFGQDRVPYHLIDIISPSEQFDLKHYQTLAYKTISDVIRRGKLPILVGGSGLYIQAVVDGYNLRTAKPMTGTRPNLEKLSVVELQQAIKREDLAFFTRLQPADQKNKRRLIRYIEILQADRETHDSFFQSSKPRYTTLVLGLEYSLSIIRTRIKKRLESRFKEGMIEEVDHLHAQGLSWQRLEQFGLEYKFIALYLQKKLSKMEMKKKLAIASGQFAKRQMTWLRRWEKQGREILWLKAQDVRNGRFRDAINRFLAEKGDMRGKDNIIAL